MTDLDATLRTESLISVEQLAARLADDSDVVVLEVGDRNLESQYRSEHIPGALYLTAEDVLRGEPTGTNGNNPLPNPAELERQIRQWGIDESTTVVVYGRGKFAQTARAWFILRWAGLTDVRYLDGGFDAWLTAHLSTSHTVAPRTPSTLQVTPASLPILTAEQAAEFSSHGILLDARDTEAYRGDPAKPESTGHIPGARSAPTAGLRNPDGTLLEPQGVAEFFAARGVDGTKPVAVYCGGGVAATFDLLALHTLGIPAAVFIGSWSEWIADPSRQVEQGQRQDPA